MPATAGAAAPAIMAGPNPRTPAIERLRLRHWAETAVLIIGAGLITTGVTNLSNPTAAATVWLLAATAVLAVLTAGHGYRTNRRRKTVHSATQVISQLLKSPVTIDRVRWTGLRLGHIVALRLRYTDLAAAANGDQIRVLTAQAVEQTLRRTFRVSRHHPDRRHIYFALSPIMPTRELTDLERQQQRVRDVAVETFGQDAAVDDFDYHDDTITRFSVHYRSAAPKLTIPAVRRRTANAVGERLAGVWKADFALEGDSVTFARRPPLPTYIARSAEPAPQPADPDYNLIPQAVDEDGNIVSWDIAGVTAHLLKAGRTRTGKTITLTGDAIEAARRGFRVFALDPKRVEFLGLRTWPNVQLVATTVPEQIALVHMLKLEMDERYRLVEEEGFPEAKFEPILFIIDEYRQLYGNVSAWWRSIKVAGMPTECPIFDEIGSLLRMAGYCRIHVDLATQRPDAAFLAGEQRDNFSARAATGRLSPDGAEMMFDNPHVGVTVPLNVRGRGTIVGVDDQPKEVQFLYTPDPRRPRNDDDRKLLAALRPSTTTWPRLVVQLPDLEEIEANLPAGKKTCLEWEQLQHATFIPHVEEDTELPREDEPVPTEPINDDFEPTETDVFPGYQDPQLMPAAALAIGDFVSLDDRGWVCVTDTARTSADCEAQIEYRSDDGAMGDLLISGSALLNVRRPLR